MAISVLLKAFTRRGLLPISLSSYESVFRNVNTSRNSSLLGKTFASLGSRAICSKPNHSDPVAQNQTKKLPESNLTKVVFKYVCANDESREHSSPFKHLIRKVLKIPGGHTFFEYRDRDVVSYYNLSDLYYSAIMRSKEAAESTSGIRVSTICFVYPSLFKEHIRSIMDSVVDALNVDCMINHIEETEDSFPIGKNLDTGCGLIRINLDKIFEIRIWEEITSGDKHVMETIVCELKRNGFDFTEDPVALQKIEEAVERAMTRMTNAIKLNLPVPAGEPDISTTISWDNCSGLPILKTICSPPNTLTGRCLQ